MKGPASFTKYIALFVMSGTNVCENAPTIKHRSFWTLKSWTGFPNNKKWSFSMWFEWKLLSKCLLHSIFCDSHHRTYPAWIIVWQGMNGKTEGVFYNVTQTEYRTLCHHTWQTPFPNRSIYSGVCGVSVRWLVMLGPGPGCFAIVVSFLALLPLSSIWVFSVPVVSPCFSIRPAYFWTFLHHQERKERNLYAILDKLSCSYNQKFGLCYYGYVFRLIILFSQLVPSP